MPTKKSKRIPSSHLLSCSVLCVALAWVSVAGPRQTQTDVLRVPELEVGFRLLYELKPAEARTQFAARQKSHPDDPLGSAVEAASYLFEEYYRQGILTSEFFLDDYRFLGDIPIKADAALRQAFFTASTRAQDLARLRLKTNPNDANALFALTISVGMQADYTSMIDKKYFDSLRLIREADKLAKRLLVIAPEGADAYLTLGSTNYIIGSLPAGKRFFLRFAGIRGDKRAGLKQIEIAATSGRYLRPFAKILLALVALREKKPDVARTQLTQLVAEFPQNPLFASELAKLNAIKSGSQPHSQGFGSNKFGSRKQTYGISGYGDSARLRSLLTESGISICLEVPAPVMNGGWVDLSLDATTRRGNGDIV